MTFLETYRPRIQQHLQTLINDHRSSYELRNAWVPDFFDRLLAFSKNGKMIRGSLFLFSCEMFGKEITEDELTIAASLEIIHSGLLAQDDIMDEDRLRRKEKTIFVQYEDLLKQNFVANASHLGESLAICFGDGAYFFAYEHILGTQLSLDVRVAVTRAISHELFQVGMAQMDDCVNPVTTIPSVQDVLSLYTHKTARYIFSLPFILGTIVTKQDETTKHNLSQLGELIGVIFQIQDELLGLFGTEEELGKPIGSDIRENRKTLYKVFLYEACSEKEKQKLNQLLGSHTLITEDIEYIRKLVRVHKVHKKIHTIIEQYLSKTIAYINTLPISTKHKEDLCTFTEFMVTRTH